MQTSIGMGMPLIMLLIPLVLVLGLLLLAVAVVVLVARSSGSTKGGESGAADARTIQEIHTGLTRLEERVEAIETILLDRTGSANEDGAGRDAQ